MQTFPCDLMIVCAFQNIGGKVFGEYGKKTAVQRGLDLVLCSVRFRIKVESLWRFKTRLTFEGIDIGEHTHVFVYFVVILYVLSSNQY